MKLFNLFLDLFDSPSIGHDCVLPAVEINAEALQDSLGDFDLSAKELDRFLDIISSVEILVIADFWVPQKRQFFLDDISN